jgi:hypothetical protein
MQGRFAQMKMDAAAELSVKDVTEKVIVVT